MAKRERAKIYSEEEIQSIEQQINLESIPYIYDTKEYPVEVIVKKFEREQLFVPHYQRNFVWKPLQQSKFIESVFLGVPIMPFLVSISGEEAELEIIDGSQRIRTLVDYVHGNLELKGLEKLSLLNGTKFTDLPTARQNKFLYRDFRFHVVTDKATSEIRADIFNRVNTSSNKLTDSEIRKGAYQGPFYEFILECSKDPNFRKLCPMSESKKERGEYDELVLRFFAFSDSYKEFKHDVARFLDDYVKNKKKAFDRESLENRFLQMCDFVKKFFAPSYFARRPNDSVTPRVRFEAISVGVYLALQENPNLEPENLDWLDSNEFKLRTTTDASNSTARLTSRIEFVRDCLLNRIQEFSYGDN